MQLDPTNPVVGLCVEGVQAEAQHQFEAASVLFQRAWNAHQSDFEAAIAAHYLARHQPSLQDSLRWNRRALEHALAAPANEVSTFLASLYLNLAYSHEMLGQAGEARHYLGLGEAALAELPESAYAAIVCDGLSRMRERMQTSKPAFYESDCQAL
jgi:hypothetical protein